MTDRVVRAVLRADAVFDLVLGTLLLSATWDALYRTLDLPMAQPALFAQVAGGLLLGFAYLLWVAPTDPAVRRPVAAVAALVNALGVVLIVVWLLRGDLGVGGLGASLLWAVVVVLAAFALLETRIAGEGRA